MSVRHHLPSEWIDEALDKSLLGYTALGYRARDLGPPAPEGALRGKRLLITGATSGIGRAAALALAELGAEITLVGRSEERAREVAAAIEALGTAPPPRIELVDLGIVGQVAALADRLIEDGRPLHRLVNNAGALFPERRETEEGLERTFATNLLGHFVLTRRLVPLLEAAGDARIVNVSSGGMYAERIRVDDLESEGASYEGARVYARTKRGQVILTEIWAEELASRGIEVHAMHPGWADTRGVRTSLPLFHRLTAPLLRSPEEGADTIVWLCAAEAPGRSTGLFWHDRKPRPLHRLPTTKESEAERRALVRELERLEEEHAG